MPLSSTKDPISVVLFAHTSRKSTDKLCSTLVDKKEVHSGRYFRCQDCLESETQQNWICHLKRANPRQKKTLVMDFRRATFTTLVSRNFLHAIPVASAIADSISIESARGPPVECLGNVPSVGLKRVCVNLWRPTRIFSKDFLVGGVSTKDLLADESNAAHMRIAGYGPPGLLASALADLCQDEGVGSAFGSNEPLSAEALFAADAIILWIPGANVPLQTVDRMHDILVMLREIRRRLVFVSLMGGDSPLEREAALLGAVFIDCGVVYENGCAEALMPLYREIWYGTKRPVPVPESKIVVVRAFELAAMILEAARATEPPKSRILAFEAMPVDLRCLATRLMRQLDIEGGLETDEHSLVRDLTPTDALEWATLTPACGALSRSVDTAGVLPSFFSDVSFDDFRRNTKRVVAIGPESDYLANALADMLGLEIPVPATLDDQSETPYGALVSRIFTEHMPDDEEEKQWQAQRLGLLRPGLWRRGFVTSARTPLQLRTVFASPQEHDDIVLRALRPTHIVALLNSNDGTDWMSDDWSLSSSAHMKAPSSLHDSQFFGADLVLLNSVDELCIYFGQKDTPAPAPVLLTHHEQEDADDTECKPPPSIAPQPPDEAAVPQTTPGAFDHLSKAEYDELYDHSTEARNYLLSNVMRPLASAMLDVVRLPPAVDKVAALADKLAVEAQRAEARTEAIAYLRFCGSFARLKNLRAIETEEDSREEAATLARQRAARNRVRRKFRR